MIKSDGEALTLNINHAWLEANPLTAAELEIEANRQTDIGWPLAIAG
ncbi:guanosine-5'-triphosphate,3'-diphosphate pyrophosphatase [Vibrio astriarenae]|nr:guanosine-5'-triphosphate,3'-diphosphate pyrophosphatase [Vibrio sp. C7]